MGKRKTKKGGKTRGRSHSSRNSHTMTTRSRSRSTSTIQRDSNVHTTNAPPDHELSTDDNITNISTIESTNESNSHNDTIQELHDNINIASDDGNITNQNIQNTTNEVPPTDSNSEQLVSNNSEQSTLEGNAESSSNQTPFASAAWNLPGGMLGSMITSGFTSSLFSPMNTSFPSTTLFSSHNDQPSTADASHQTNLPHDTTDPSTPTVSTNVTTNRSRISTPSISSFDIPLTPRSLPIMGGSTPVTQESPDLDTSTDSDPRSLPEFHYMPSSNEPRSYMDPIIVNLYRTMSIKNQYLKQDLMNAKEEYEHRESILNQKMSTIQDENKTLHKVTQKMNKDAKEKLSLIANMDKAYAKAINDNDDFASNLDRAREDCDAALLAHDILSDENDALKRRIKELEAHQRSNDDFKRRFEELQQRHRSLSQVPPTKSLSSHDSSSSHPAKSVAFHSSPPDLDDSVAPPNLDDSVAPPNVLPSKNVTIKTTPEIQRLRDKRDQKASKLNASLKTVTTVKSPNTSPSTTIQDSTNQDDSALAFNSNTSTTETINNAQSRLLRRIIDRILLPISPGKVPDPSFDLPKLHDIYEKYTTPDTFTDLNIERIDKADTQL